MIVGPSDRRWAPAGDWNQITIFLSPMDVHMNRIPVDGRVTKIEYKPGTFLPAYNEGSNDNEMTRSGSITTDTRWWCARWSAFSPAGSSAA